jgi:proton-dependent oligopeptide transporter, POT family
MVSGAYLTLFVSNILMGWVGSFYEKMTPAAFWTLDAAIAAIGALLVVVFGRRLTRALSTC